MNTRIRSVLIIIGILTLIVIGIIVIPRTVSLYYQIKGGQQVEYVLRFSEGINELVCEPLLSDDGGALREVEQGVVDLNRAIRFNNNNAQAYYYLGKANCLLGHLNQAKENYFRYTQLRSSNPLGFMGLGFTYEKLGDKISAKSAWESADLVPEDFYNIGDDEFEMEHYENAIRWYERAEIIDGEESTSRQFIWAVAEILSRKLSPNRVDSSILPIYPVTDSVQIEGETLRWFNPIRGNIVESYTSGDTIAGGLWWTGCALTAIEIENAGYYQLTVRVQDIPPAPIVFQIRHNFTTIQEFSLVSEDNHWEQLNTYANFDVGVHLLSICFLNDGSSKGMDRNLLIDYLKISAESF